MAVGLARKAADDLAHRPVASSAARPVSPLPALLFTTVRSLGALRDQAVDQLVGNAGRAEAANQTVAPSATPASACATERMLSC
jgi:hypothetical protein